MKRVARSFRLTWINICRLYQTIPTIWATRFGSTHAMRSRARLPIPYCPLSTRAWSKWSPNAEVDGLFIAAHIDRPSFSVISQLGFISPQRRFDAIEYSNHQRFSQLIEQQRYLSKYIAYSASDAHQIDQIGEKYAILESEGLSFNALRNILKNKYKQFIYSHLNG